ncbi:MAG: hypothetical protein A2358_03520 [Candidatus Staskawiczbacteria bacterium RIFOXYB1_FULL_37_44]|uniref:PsbP C-terminal domain-containing protein n=1 Tax=Candidatus Staskawiczbacteria bacterium RIFOXYB1_FULL_37_44 TaxID=1802223 RepID=A0A1G2IUT2_9BACT|nr:MAG: hypothetical protein A2358_03520 [Candidatus Staskawiczbacteria bacterium RIFOXYB1_FULL_37_44]OGZ83445.1 MAG: hypothetical protein A2416_00780 [Candidatus Staskawiczbacteria bacterium RIFOXYC1_FULL_37_52]OGZ87847.1 MAG: hypothetical protein A2444_01995 [Candidatus Staskawiczbacteria bacterium RIFOXYC2_FULL_37_19]OGZ88889.1 MAG: hypothetical protein A2581_00090 [Candidatus Staskawiczbacteria bacterium RIFOXYD1_FULL_37_110]
MESFQTDTDTKTKKRIPIWLGFIIILIVAILLLCGVFVYQYSTKSQSQITDWKTYKNDEYGFELKYPQNAVGLSAFENQVLATEFAGGQKAIIKKPLITIHPGKNVANGDGYVVIYVGTNKENIDNCLKFKFYEPNGNMTDIKDINGTKFYTQSEGNPAMLKPLETQYSIVKDNICYTIDTYVSAVDVKKNLVYNNLFLRIYQPGYIKAQKDFINGVISNFKFTK